jgi:hypothetical protein
MQPITRQTVVERRQPNLRWGSVFAGTVFAVGLWILLQALGMGLGLSAIDTDDAGNLKGVGIGAGIWSILSPLIAIFCGGLIAGRMASARDRMGAAIHGAVVWALMTVVGLWAVVAIVSTLASGVARVGGAVASATGSVVSSSLQAGGQVDAGKVMNALGLHANDLLAPLNQRLQQNGKPPITADQLGAALKGIAQRGVREGRLDEQVVDDEITKSTSLSRADAEDLGRQVSQRYDQLSTDLQQGAQRVGERAKGAALEAANKTGKALFYGGIELLLSLVAAVLGAALGARRYLVTTATATASVSPPRPPEA